MTIVTRIEGTDMVGYWPGVAEPLARVSLPKLARRLAARGHDACARVRSSHFKQLGREEVGLSFGKRLKKGLLKTLVVAHKLTHNKAFEAIHKKIQNAVPKPYKVFVTIHNALAARVHKFLGKVTGDKKTFGPTATTSDAYRKLLPKVAATAQGKLSLSDLKAESLKSGVDFRDAKALASMGKLAGLAKVDPKARATLVLMDTLNKARSEATQKRVGPALERAAVFAQEASRPRVVRRNAVEAGLQRAFPKALAFTVHAEGKSFNTIVVPA
jgi:hypothetical protein